MTKIEGLWGTLALNIEKARKIEARAKAKYEEAEAARKEAEKILWAAVDAACQKEPGRPRSVVVGPYEYEAGFQQVTKIADQESAKAMCIEAGLIHCLGAVKHGELRTALDAGSVENERLAERLYRQLVTEPVAKLYRTKAKR